MNRLAFALILAALAAGCSERKAAAPAPQPVWPPPIQEGRVRLSPGVDMVDQGNNVDVFVEANSGQVPIGAFSLRLTFNHAAFELLSLTSGGSDLHEPAHWSQTAPGTVYMAFMNSAEADLTVIGLQRIARLRFRAIGQSGDNMNLRGDLLSFGDTAYPASCISPEPLPSSVERLCGVTIR